MSATPEAPKGPVEQLREILERLVPLLTPDVEPASSIALERASSRELETERGERS